MTFFKSSLCSFVLVASCIAFAGCKSDNEPARDEDPQGSAETRLVTLKVTGLDSADAESAVKEVLENNSAVSSVSVDLETNQVSFLLGTEDSVDKVVEALKEAGYEAEEPTDSGETQQEASNSTESDHPDHPTDSSGSSDSEHPSDSSDSEHPEHPDHPDHPKNAGSGK